LLTTCRQVNREVFAIFFSLATFHLPFPYDRILYRIKKNALELITTVEVDGDNIESWANRWPSRGRWVLLPSLKLMKVLVHCCHDCTTEDLAELKEAAMEFAYRRSEEGIVEVLFES
jgi:hypothetical protein